MNTTKCNSTVRVLRSDFAEAIISRGERWNVPFNEAIAENIHYLFYIIIKLTVTFQK